jgi:hypothetical protein
VDLTALLAETSPAPERPTSQALARARGRMDEASAAAARRTRAIRVAKARRRRRLLLASVAAAAVLLLVPVISNRPGGAVPSAAAVDAMLAASRAAGEQGGDWADAAYWHLTLELDYPTIRGQQPYRQELWLAHRGNGVQTSTDPAIPTAADGAALYRDTGPSRFTAGGSVDWDGLYALPTDADELAGVLRRGVRHAENEWDEDTQMWVMVTDLLRFNPASSALRRALWQVAASIPGVELVGRTTDTLDRPGIALERDMSGEGLYRARLIFDPDTGDVLEERTYAADGTLDYRMTVVEQGPSDVAPAPDPPYCGPGSEPYRSC